MNTQLELFALDNDARLFAIRDESGRTIGTGTREVCETLVHLVNQRSTELSHFARRNEPVPHVNVRAAIVI